MRAASRATEQSLSRLADCLIWHRIAEGPIGSVPMHTRSKRYIRRQRARLCATRRRDARKYTLSPNEARLAFHVAAGLKKLGFGVGLMGPIKTLLEQPRPW
jgi:hypothetical protein